MVRVGTAHVEGAEGVAVLQAPDYDRLHRVHAEVLYIMLEDNRRFHAAAAGLDVGDNDVRLRRLSRVARGHIPVKILIAHVGKRFRQAGHYARIEIADRVGASAGETTQLRVAACLLVYDLLHSVEVIEERFLAGVDGLIVVRVAVYADGVPFVHLSGQSCHNTFGFAAVTKNVAFTLYSASTSRSFEVYGPGPSSKVR